MAIVHQFAAMRKHLAAVLFALFLTPAFGQVPPPVPALPDAPRLTTYSISGTTCACAVNYALYGDGTDFYSWVEVYLNGVRVNYNDATYGWTITSPSGSLGSLPRPITNAVLTFTNAQTGTVQIVGARRPRRLSQFTENRGVAARDLNQALTDIIAENRETWDKVNDVTGRAMISQPGNTVGLLPLPSLCVGGWLGFDGTGLNPVCRSASPGSGNVVGPGTSTNGDIAIWNNTTGSLLADKSIANFSGSALTLTGTLATVVTDPIAQFSVPAFAYPSTLTGPGGWGVNVTWDGSAAANGSAFYAQTTASTTAPGTGAPTAISAGTLVRRNGLDATAILGYINNSTDVTLSNGAAQEGIVRGYINGGSGSPTGDTSDAFRAVSETNDAAGSNPRAGIYIFQSGANNAFLKGVFVSGAKDYGVRVGEGAVASNVIEPTTPFAWVRTDASMPWSVNKTGQMVSALSTGTAPMTVASTTLVSNLHAAQADVLTAGSNIPVVTLAWSATAPTIASGFCSTASNTTISASNGTAAFDILIGGATCGSTGTLTMPAATTGWVCSAADVTTPASHNVVQTGTQGSTTAVVLTDYARTTGIAQNFNPLDHIHVQCTGF